MKILIGVSSTNYIDRPQGSNSKLSTYTDGIKILFMLNKLFFLIKPIASFSIVSALLAISLIIIAWFQVFTPLLYFGAITKYPSVILSSSLMILAIFLLMACIVNNSISDMRKDQFRLMYLNIKKIRNTS